ncbi:MAG TPA: sulfite exporter TauE/SafE family protein [Verrucomicrobiae bacterium]|nr:sulfite exporter TauE/SafE family protein [Verrucomicrobiae bacterium]
MSALLTLGAAPVVSTASVHAAEVVLAAVSGGWHGVLGNVDRSMLKGLIIPGACGAAAGAFAATRLPTHYLGMAVSVYLLLVGTAVIRRGLRRGDREVHPRRLPTPALGAVGGFCDAVGGGGWGAVVSSTLIKNGSLPRFAIGTVSAAEFFVSAAASVTFLLSADLRLCRSIILALLAGGVVAAPLAAYLAKVLPVRPLTILVGLTVTALSLRRIALLLAG